MKRSYELCLVILFVNFLFTNVISTSFELTTRYNSESILCRSCGSVLTSSTNIISNQSPYSTYSVYDSLFGQSDVLVQVLTDIFLSFPVITFDNSSCTIINEYEGKLPWFPGYIGQPCVCPDCGDLVGWIFKPINNDVIKPHKPFYALILTSVIDETCNYETMKSF